MSEQEPSKEVERTIVNPIHGKCPECQGHILSTYSNTVVFRWEKQPWFDFVRIACQHDDGFVYTWGKEANEKLGENWTEQFIIFSDPEHPYCDDESIIARRKEDLGIVDIEPVELSERSLEHIKHIGEFLQKITVDVSDFYPNGETS